MKKTLTVNFSGTVFHIDEDAYYLLENYLDNLKSYFSKLEDGSEIVCDIESRISELFNDKISTGQQVITIADAEQVIRQMGKPEEFEVSHDDESDQSHTTDSSSNNLSKRLYRNPDDKMLGGVFGGIAAYLGWDVTLVRILAILLLFLGYGTLVPIYIICWILIPEARTATEKLSMRGEEINVGSIGKTVTDGFDKATQSVNDFVNSNKPRTWLQKVGDTIVYVVGILLKVLLILLAVVFGPVLLLLAFVLLIMIIGAIGMAAGSSFAIMSVIPFSEYIPMIYAPSVWTVMLCIGSILFLAIPFGALIYLILASLFSWNGIKGGVKWVFFITWLLSIFMVIAGLCFW